MKILVQKFGGTSVATRESRELVYKKIITAKEEGFAVVAVISAMGRKGEPYATDTLLDLITSDNPKSEPRELDLIFTCGEIISGTIVTCNLQGLGYKAKYLTGLQAGIITTAYYSDARILEIKTEKVKKLLLEGNIVVVAGGQGATLDNEITTLGRGGSDTTACSLGVALNAERIEIYTDVEGIMTTDPRIVNEAKLIEKISYKVCCEMAYQGAKVMHPRAVEIASLKPKIELFVRSVFSNNKGTLICDYNNEPKGGADLLKNIEPVGVALLTSQIIFVAHSVDVNKKLELLNIIDNMQQEIHEIHPETNEIILVLHETSYKEVEKILNELKISGDWNKGLSKISVVGDNLDKLQFVALLFSTLKNSDIPIIASKCDKNTISTWVKCDKGRDTVKATHQLIINLGGIKNGM